MTRASNSNLDALRRSAHATLAGFHQDQRGSVSYFGITLFLLMVMMGGATVDFMRFETTRTELQNTLDRAVLAAAPLSQRLDSEEVVRDYFDKAGLTEFLSDVDVEEALNYKQVTATAAASSEPIFLHLVGIDDLEAYGASKALQKITNVEIALVLDISGSMLGQKTTNLKIAAKEFVDTMLANDPDFHVSIAVVPYNAQVNVPLALRQKFNAINDPGITNFNCMEFPSTLYSVPKISRTTAIPMQARADMSGATNKVTSYVAPTDATYAIPAYPTTACDPNLPQVRLPSHDKDTIKAQIDLLFANGNTSIMYGMKWGVAMLDPDMRTPFNELADAGEMPTEFIGRPFDYTDPETLKAIVLMTDGEHVVYDRVTNSYKTGASTIYKSTGDGKYSVYHAGRSGSNKYYRPDNNTWYAAAYNSGSGVVRQDWSQVWSNLKLTYVAWQFYARPLGGSSSSDRNTQYNNFIALVKSSGSSTSVLNTQLQQSCTQAKNNDVVVYGIALEAPANGTTQILSCATDALHFFDTTGPELTAVFRTIASDISQLRLTQ